MIAIDTNVFVYAIDAGEPVKQAIFERAFQLHSRHSLSHWDSLLVAACAEGGATRLFSEDLQDGADYDGVKVVNPFL